MIRFLVVALVNVLVVALVAMQAVPPLLAGCDMDGSCANGSGPMTWLLGVGVPLASLVGLVFAGRAMLRKGPGKDDSQEWGSGAGEPVRAAETPSAPIAPTIADGAGTDAPVLPDEVRAEETPPRKSLFGGRNRAEAIEATRREQAEDASALSRLSRVRATAEAEIALMPEERGTDDASFVDPLPESEGPEQEPGTEAAEQPALVDPAGAPVAESRDTTPSGPKGEPFLSPGDGAALRIIPFDFDALESAAEEDAYGLDWMFDGSRIASPDDTGFPWVVATIDRFCEAVMEDVGTLLSETLRSEAQAWRTAVAPLPRDDLIAGRDAHDFVGWANHCVAFAGGGGRALVADAMDRLREEARDDPRITALLPVALLDRDIDTPRVLSA